jgi:hypothetical protein
MFLSINSVRFSFRNCFFVALFLFAPISAAAQTVEAAQAPAAIGGDDFTTWYIAIAVLGAAFFASVVYWRREKAKRETFSSRRNATSSRSANKHEPVRKPRPQNAVSGSGKRTETEINAEITDWIRSNLDKKAAEKKSGDFAPVERRVASAVATVPEVKEESRRNAKKQIPFFLMPPTPAPFVPLPLSQDEFLLEAIEQLQDFDAAEDERTVGVRVLSAFKSRNAVEALTTVAHYDQSARLRIAALDALAAFDHESVFETILMACADPAREVRAAAARALSRLNVNRTDAFNRIVESRDRERLRLAALACLEAGFAKQAFQRLLHEDERQANEAFAIIRLLISAGEITPVMSVFAKSGDEEVKLATVAALRGLRSKDILPSLYDLMRRENFVPEVRKAINDLIDDLSAK